MDMGFSSPIPILGKEKPGTKATDMLLGFKLHQSIIMVLLHNIIAIIPQVICKLYSMH